MTLSLSALEHARLDKVVIAEVGMVYRRCVGVHFVGEDASSTDGFKAKTETADAGEDFQECKRGIIY